MKIRAEGAGVRWTSHPGALLVHPGLGLEKLDLHDCVVMAELPPWGESTTAHAHVIVDGPLPEEIDRAFEHVDELLENVPGEVSLTLFLRPDARPDLEYVLTSEQGQALSLSVVETRAERTVVAFARAREGDRPIDDFVAGLRLSDMSAARARREVEHGLREENRVLRRKLLDLLAFALESAGARTEAVGEVSGPGEPDPLSVRRLEDELIRVTRDRDALQRKYTALAESRLGRMTLDRWERRRRR